MAPHSLTIAAPLFAGGDLSERPARLLFVLVPIEAELARLPDAPPFAREADAAKEIRPEDKRIEAVSVSRWINADEVHFHQDR